MTKRKFIINVEQCEAAREEARNRNPNKIRIDELRAQSRLIADEIFALTTDEEKYNNLMLALASFENKNLAVSFMSNQELSEHLYNLFIPHAENEMDEAILSETMNRLGWQPEDLDEEGEINNG